ncbi:MAG TPA: hypothetical protein VE685_13005 [Thermoanaerobaculia bacterium]|nr:hypothetical protein [Thermoanaerobaculia bacterium]
MAFFILALLIISILGATPNAPGSCVVRVDEPSDEQEAGRYVSVRGAAELPASHHLWVFSRPESRRPKELWWPQYEGKRGSDGKWRVRARLGTSENIGDEFVVAVGVFEEKEHQFLGSYLEQSWNTGEFKAIEMPKVACPPVFRVVKKTSDQ